MTIDASHATLAWPFRNAVRYLAIPGEPEEEPGVQRAKYRAASILHGGPCRNRKVTPKAGMTQRRLSRPTKWKETLNG